MSHFLLYYHNIYFLFYDKGILKNIKKIVRFHIFNLCEFRFIYINRGSMLYRHFYDNIKV